MIPADFQPTLVGPHVIVRPIAATDWHELFAVAADPEIWALHPMTNRHTEPVFRVFFDGAIASGGPRFVLEPQGQIIWQQVSFDQSQ